MLPCPFLAGANHPGLLAVRQRDTVTENRCHRPDAVGHITALPVTLREAHPVTGSHPDGVRSVQCDAFSHRLPGRNQPRVTFRILQGYQPVILTDTGNPVINRKSTRLNSSHVSISYAVFCLKKKTDQ